MSYVEKLIQVAPDSPMQTAIIPVAISPTAKEGKKTVAVLEYELLITEPYTYKQDKAQFAVRVKHKNIPEAELEEPYAAFVARPRACFRASPLKAPSMSD